MPHFRLLVASCFNAAKQERPFGIDAVAVRATCCRPMALNLKLVRNCPLFTTLCCVSITPLGIPLVPIVYRMFAKSSTATSSGSLPSASSSAPISRYTLSLRKYRGPLIWRIGGGRFPNAAIDTHIDAGPQLEPNWILGVALAVRPRVIQPSL
jgi:hypothetical protein